MPEDSPDASALSRLISLPGVVALAVLGLAIAGASQFLGADTLLQEVATEVIASLGNAVLLLAVFGLLFRGGLERLLRGMPGGDAYAGFAERVREMLQELGRQDPTQPKSREGRARSAARPHRGGRSIPGRKRRPRTEGRGAGTPGTAGNTVPSGRLADRWGGQIGRRTRGALDQGRGPEPRAR
jgi:hypothetical protein